MKCLVRNERLDDSPQDNANIPLNVIILNIIIPLGIEVTLPQCTRLNARNAIMDAGGGAQLTIYYKYDIVASSQFFSGEDTGLLQDHTKE